MKMLHHLHVWIEGGLRRFQIATLHPMAPFDQLHKLRMRQVYLDDKLRRIS